MGKYDADPVKRKASVAKSRRSTPTPEQIASRNKALRNQRIAIIAGCCAALLVLIIVIVCLLVNAGNADDGKILPNVYAAGIHLGGMSKDDARNALRLAVNNSLAKNPMVVILPDGILELNPEDTHVSVDVDAVVEAAYSYGRTGSKDEQKALREQAGETVHTIALLPYMKTLDLQYIYDEVDYFCSTHGSQVPSKVTITGDRPTYDPNFPNMVVNHQILTITIGAPDYKLTTDELYAQVLDAYSLNIMELTCDLPTSTQPEPLDAEEIFNQYCLAPTNAVQDPVTYEITPETYGYGFDIDEIQRQLDLAGFGEVIEVKLGFLYPNITTKDLQEGVFADILSQFTATGEDAENRNINLNLSCQAINGMIISPGETFSFNDALGRLTTQNGYVQYPGYRNGVMTDILGGGIEQTASALYYCALMADLEILERTNNGYAVDYIALGLDVCIEWGVYDLKFVNNTDAPIRIDAVAEGSSVSIQLIGTNSRNYTVNIITEELERYNPTTTYQKMDKNNIYGYTNGTVLQEGITGYLVQTTLERVHTQTELVISTTVVSLSPYGKRDEIVVSIMETPAPIEPEV